MLDKLTIDFSRPMPLFPLPGCVLLPHATIPLHIFENRYRHMVSDVLDSHGLIAMSLFEGDSWRQDYKDCPPVRPHVCVGYVVKHDRLRDGRYNLLLQGVCRARIHEEIEHEPYRMAMFEPTEPRQPMEIDLDGQRSRIEALLSRPLLKELASVSAIHNWLSNEIPTAALVDLGIMTVCCDVEQRYAMLKQDCVFNRAQWLEEILQKTLHTLNIAERFRAEAQTGGVYVN